MPIFPTNIRETLATIGSLFVRATEKAAPVDADLVGISDSAAGGVLKKLTWANLKATLKTYFDTLYPSGSGTCSGTNTGDQTLAGLGGASLSGVQTLTNKRITPRVVELPYNDAAITVGGTPAYNTDNADTFVIDGMASAIALCTELRADIINHCANAARHITGQQSTAAIGAVPTNLATLLATTGTLLAAYEAHNADVILAEGWAYHDAQDTTHALVSAVTPVTLAEARTRLNDLKAKYNAHELESTGHHGVGTVAADQTAAADAVSGLTQGTNFGAPGGTPLEGEEILFIVGDDGSAWALTWDAVFDAGDELSLPITTVAGKEAYYKFIWRAAAAKFRYLGELGGF